LAIQEEQEVEGLRGSRDRKVRWVSRDRLEYRVNLVPPAILGSQDRQVEPVHPVLQVLKGSLELLARLAIRVNKDLQDQLVKRDSQEKAVPLVL
jgi:hypothetical protein